MSYKSRTGRSKGSPPESADAVRLDALAQKSAATGPLHLKCRLECIDRRENHSESRGAVSASVLEHSIVILRQKPNLIEANTVLKRTGMSLRYELDCRSASIPAFAAVSPNLETGPIVII